MADAYLEELARVIEKLDAIPKPRVAALKMSSRTYEAFRKQCHVEVVVTPVWTHSGVPIALDETMFDGMWEALDCEQYDAFLKRKVVRCPECKSDFVEVTTKGSLVGDARNQAPCLVCAHGWTEVSDG